METRSQRADGAIGWVIAGSAALLAGISLVTWRTYCYYEDGFYYLKIAQQLASGAGSTFDGVTRTNGYHPLWLLTLVPLFWLTSEPEVAQAAAIGIQGLLMGGGALLAYRIGRLLLAPVAAAFGAVLWIQFVRGPALGGLEYAIHAFLVLAIMLLYGQRFATGSMASPAAHLALGCLLALAFLARLDTAALAGTVGTAVSVRAWRQRPKGPQIPALLALGAPLAVAVAGYLALNLFWFGHPGPVSTAHKRAWSGWLLAQDPYYLTGGWPLAKIHSLVWTFWRSETVEVRIPVWIGSAGAAAFWLLGRRHGAAGRLAFARRAGAPFVAFSMLQLLGYSVVYHGALSFPHWYYVIQPFLAAWLAAAGFDWLVRRATALPRRGAAAGRLAVALGWMAISLVTLGGFFRVWAASSRPDQLIDAFHDAGHWLRANTPAQARIGSWNAGTIGYVSRRAVINLDGLVNSWDFFEVDRFNLCRYWDKVGITYLVDGFDGQRVLWTLPPYELDVRCRDRLELVWSKPLHAGASVRAYRIHPPGR